MNIYTVTVIDSIDNSTRCLGFYCELDKAVNAVLNNQGEMCEFKYDHVVIELFKEGVWGRVLEEKWFSWDNTKWVECDRPKKYTSCGHVTNFAMG